MDGRMSFESKEEQPDFGPLEGNRLFLRDGRQGEVVEVGGVEGTGFWSVTFEEGGEYHVVARSEELNAWEEV